MKNANHQRHLELQAWTDSLSRPNVLMTTLTIANAAIDKIKGATSFFASSKAKAAHSEQEHANTSTPSRRCR